MALLNMLTSNVSMFSQTLAMLLSPPQRRGTVQVNQREQASHGAQIAGGVSDCAFVHTSTDSSQSNHDIAVVSSPDNALDYAYYDIRDTSYYYFA